VKTPDSWETCTLATFEQRGTDERHGPFTAWHRNGQPSRQGEYRYNLPVGKISYWFDNGQKQMEGMYVDGRQEGVWTWWHANGQKSITGEYHDANPVGKWAWWQANGKIAQRADLSAEKPLTSPVPTPEQGGEAREAKLQLFEPGLPLR
jgi:antitoxin component YwqK of YwqJK toxin-antitoxin module